MKNIVSVNEGDVTIWPKGKDKILTDFNRKTNKIIALLCSWTQRSLCGTESQRKICLHFC